MMLMPIKNHEILQQILDVTPIKNSRVEVL